MSMSQEEIEALMNGLDEPAPEESVAVDEVVPDESTEMSTDDIENLIAQTQTSDEPEETEEPASTDDSIDTNDIDDLLAQLDGAESNTPDTAKSIEDIVPDIEPEEEESIEESASVEEDVDTSDIDDLLAGIDGVTDDEPEDDSGEADDGAHEAIARAWTNDKVDQGVFPSPVEPDTKVVGQLSQVANDSEEKAGLIFDVLSLILDENNEIQKNSKQADEFVEEQVKLLTTLTQKFPNIVIFKEQLNRALEIQGKGKESCDKIDNVNMKIFEAMEQMQFFDINRQKIERVMSVIKKLSNYLNNLFEDTEGYHDVQIAKHIHGDPNATVEGEDLEALIAEFNK